MTGMMANLVAKSGDNKGQFSNLAEAICRDFRQHDKAETDRLLEWSKIMKTKGNNKDKPDRPEIAFWFPQTDTTRPAFLQNAIGCETLGGRTQYFNLPEVEMADGLCGGHKQVSHMLRNVYDTPGERLFLQLKEVLPDLVRHQLPEGCKDYSDYFLRVRS